MAGSEVKVPAVVAAGLICFALGTGAGALGMTFFGYTMKRPTADAGSASGGEGQPAPPGPGRMMPGGPGRPGGGPGRPGGPPGGMMGMMGRGPSSKNQLAALVTKLDQLTGEPLQVSLDEERRAKVREQLQGLEKMEELSDDEAKKRLDALLAIVKDDRKTLETAGYRWPGQGFGFPRPSTAANPFTEGENARRLESLQKRLAGSNER